MACAGKISSDARGRRGSSGSRIKPVSIRRVETVITVLMRPASKVVDTPFDSPEGVQK